MKAIKEKLSVLISGLIITALLISLYIFQPHNFKKIEYVVYDTLLARVDQSEPSGLVTIVDIDEKSLAQVGQWPWPRYKVAALLEKLQKMQVLSVGIDFLFAEPDRTSLKNIAHDFQSTFQQSLALDGITPELLDNDQKMSQILAFGPFITGYSFLFEKGEKRVNEKLVKTTIHPLNVLFLYEEGTDKNDMLWYKANNLVNSLEVFASAVNLSGFFNVSPDHDGIIRKVPLMMQYQDKLYPSLSLATLMTAIQAQQLVLKTTADGLNSLILDEQKIPLDKQGNIWIHFRDTNQSAFQTISAVDILNDQVSQQQLENRIVLIGTSAKGLYDLRTTPYNAIFPGVEIHATIIDNIIRGDFINHPSWSWLAQLGLMLFVGLISLIVIAWTKALPSFILNLLLIVLLVSGSWWWLQQDRIYLSVFYPVLLILLNFGILSVLQYRLKEKKLMRETLEHNQIQAVVLADLTQAKSELEILSNDLEQQVIERTHSLSESNKKLSSSIRYASLIQHSLIPESDLIRKHFKESFIIWQPKDVVGGDIYLFEELRGADECLLMVIDCTGHGVPGAFVTMLVKAIEREIVANINGGNRDVSPAEILSYFNQSIKKLLKQESDDSISNAGFDGGILYYNKIQQQMKFSGAETNLFMLEDNTLKIIKGSRHSIGYKKSDADYVFKEHIIDVKEDMQLYITTDGYLDQKGGEKGFCFGKKRLQNNLTTCDNIPMQKQKEILLNQLSEYQGSHERNDDVTFIGVKI